MLDRRESSAKLVFFTISLDGAEIQVLANFSAYGDKEHWGKLIDVLRRGDVIGVEGHPGTSNS